MRDARPSPEDLAFEAGSRPLDIGWGVSLPRPHNEAAERASLVPDISQPGLEEFVSLHAIPTVIKMII